MKENILVRLKVFRIFALRQYLTAFNKCWIKKLLYFKLMPGSTFGVLGTVAGSYSQLRRAVLFLFLSFSSFLNTATNG